MMITSTANDQIKFIRKLREKKYRSESGLFYIEGIRIVVEAMQKPERVHTLIVAPGLVQSGMVKEVMGLAEKSCIPVLEVSQDVFGSFSLKDGPQGVAALVREVWLKPAGVDWSRMGLWTALDSVADPGNLGTIMRTLDAVRARGLFLIDQCTDPYDPTAIRASMGAIFSLELIKMPADEFQTLKTERGLFCVGTSDAASENYQMVQYPSNMVLVMGSERQGLKRKLMDICDHVVSIPMAGKSDSLNLAVATGVMLYEIYNQHGRKTHS